MAKQSQWPEVRDISVADLIDIMAAGLRDFRAAPKYGLVVGGVFALGGWLLLIMLWKLGLIYLSYPVAMGFALIAPFAAVGFYAVSERLESGKPLSWGALWGAIRGSTQRDLRWMALITGFAFFIWVDMAAMLFMVFIGFNALDGNFFNTLFGTTEGWMFLIVGNFAGAVLAMIVFSISVVSFPMLFDRDVDFVTAMVTSVRLVIANPKSMGDLVHHHRGPDGTCSDVGVRRARRGPAGYRPCDLASVPPRRRTRCGECVRYGRSRDAMS